MAQQPMAIRRMYTHGELLRAMAIGAIAATAAATLLIVGFDYAARIFFS